MSKNKKIFISILNFNGFELTDDCINSILKSDYQNFSLNIIDNGSTDNSLILLEKKYPDLNFIKIKSNCGFAGAQNRAFLEALKSGEEYIYLMTNDTVIHESALEEMLRLMESDTSIGACSPKIYFHSHPDVLWFFGGDINIKTGKPKLFSQYEKDVGQFEKNLF